jgi:hypothetical protein
MVSSFFILLGAAVVVADPVDSTLIKPCLDFSGKAETSKAGVAVRDLAKKIKAKAITDASTCTYDGTVDWQKKSSLLASFSEEAHSIDKDAVICFLDMRLLYTAAVIVVNEVVPIAVSPSCSEVERQAIRRTVCEDNDFGDDVTECNMEFHDPVCNSPPSNVPTPAPGTTDKCAQVAGTAEGTEAGKQVQVEYKTIMHNAFAGCALSTFSANDEWDENKDLQANFTSVVDAINEPHRICWMDLSVDLHYGYQNLSDVTVVIPKLSPIAIAKSCNAVDRQELLHTLCEDGEDDDRAAEQDCKLTFSDPLCATPPAPPQKKGVPKKKIGTIVASTIVVLVVVGAGLVGFRRIRSSNVPPASGLDAGLIYKQEGDASVDSKVNDL